MRRPSIWTGSPARLRGAKSPRPPNALRQGDLDGLCGIYSIVNAARLAAWPSRISRDEASDLFVALMLRADGGEQDHWSVARSITAQNLILFDSSSMNRVSLDRCHIRQPHNGAARHVIDPASIIQFRTVDTE